MTAFQIYLVLQLDEIGKALGILLILSSCVAGLGGFFYLITAEDTDEPARVTLGQWVKRAFFTMLITLSVATVLPSSRTAAAMIVLPQIVNNPGIQREANELYMLAKEALRSLATPEEKKQ